MSESVTAPPGDTMKAAVHHEYGPPERVVGIEEVPRPSIGGNDVLVRVHAAGVNWADRSMTLGIPYLMRLGYGLRNPRKGIRGMDVAGTVVAVGSNVSDFEVGDEVFGWCSGAFAEYVAVASGRLVSKPTGVTFTEAAAIPMAGCVALQALRDVGGVGAGSKVLIVGASGGIGTFAVQIAKALGAEVTGVCSTRNLPLVSALGADHVIDYTVDDFVAGSRRYDLILDQADRHTVGERQRVLETHGVLIPNSGEGGPWLGSIGRILKARVVSPFVSQKLKPFLSVTKRDDLATLCEMIRDGQVKPVVGEVFTLPEAGRAIARAGSGHATGNIVVGVIPEEA